MRGKQKQQTPIRKPKGSRNMTVDGHLYYWSLYGPFDHVPPDLQTAYKGEDLHNLSGIIVWDSESRQRWNARWIDVAHYDDGAPFYPILPKHVAAYIKENIQKGS